MSWMTVAASGAMSLAGGLMGSRSAKKAAHQQALAAELARQAAVQRERETKESYQPYLEAGQEATQTLRGLLGQGGPLLQDYEFYEDPGYQFGRQQGEQALTRQQSARGLRLSPASLGALMRYNQDYAGTKYNEGFQRDQASKAQKYGFLAGQSGQGLSAAGSLGGLRAGYSGQIGSALTGAGNAQAAGTMGSANSWINALGNIGGAVTQQGILDKYLKGSGGTGGTGAQANPGAYDDMFSSVFGRRG